ncbi:MAG: gamma-glutamylcyclotransferase, partial [Acidobacteriota bacterium]
MSWFDQLVQPGHIAEAVVHINESRKRMERGHPKTEVSRLLFDALNKVQTEWVLHLRGEQLGEVRAFQTMILEGVDEEDRGRFLRSDELKQLVEFEPQVMNHQTLRQRGYRPNVELTGHLVREASQEHRKLRTAYDALLLQREDATEDRVLERAAELLYIIRSNIAHGEKTPYGPDLEKRERDEQVSNVVVPVQIVLLDLLLDRPSQKLFSYGTLAPGQRNHEVVSGLGGSWQTCGAYGQLDDVGGLQVFRWNPVGPRIKGQLLVSPDLPERWSQLDQFEGDSYKRRWITVAVDAR